ncbi:MAG TPA: ORF6N domain-containing protein [Lacunisphaera sp.]|nr:ORF6N domain-containing protein [Lacunisphaera sp.]
MSKSPELPPVHTIRRQRVVLDSDLARLYGVLTKVFNQTIQRNAARFPDDFAFQITREEFANLKSQIVTSSSGTKDLALVGHGGARKLPWVFTEHGAIMAATLLRSSRAIAMSVYVVRAFVQMKEALLANATILKRLAQIDKKLITHDVILRDVYEKLRPLLAPPPEPPRKELGYHTTLKKP